MATRVRAGLNDMRIVRLVFLTLGVSCIVALGLALSRLVSLPWSTGLLLCGGLVSFLLVVDSVRKSAIVALLRGGLALVYVVVILPWGLAARLLGKKFLDLEFRTARGTYWTPTAPANSGKQATVGRYA